MSTIDVSFCSDESSQPLKHIVFTYVLFVFTLMDESCHTHTAGRVMLHTDMSPSRRGGGLGSSTIFKKFNEPYAPS